MNEKNQFALMRELVDAIGSGTKVPGFYFIGNKVSYEIKRSAGCALARNGKLPLKRPRLSREFRLRNSLFCYTLEESITFGLLRKRS